MDVCVGQTSKVNAVHTAYKNGSSAVSATASNTTIKGNPAPAASTGMLVGRSLVQSLFDKSRQGQGCLVHLGRVVPDLHVPKLLLCELVHRIVEVRVG